MKTPSPGMGEGAVRFLSGADTLSKSHSKQQPLPDDNLQPQILVAEEGEDIAVTVFPTQSIGHDRNFSEYGRAAAYARLIRLEFGWRIVDRCAASTRRRAANGGR